MATHHDLPALVLFSLLAALAAPPAAQEEAPARGPAPKVPAGGPTLLALDRLLNTAVHAESGKAAEDDGDAGGEAAGAAGRDNVGVLSDLVIDTLAQRLTFAVVHTSEGARAVPVATLSWDGASHGWLMSGGKAALDRARTFEASRLDELHEDGGAEPERQDGGSDDKEAKEAGAPPERPHAGGSLLAPSAAGTTSVSGRYMLATVAARRDVMADDGRFAPAIGLVVEARTGVPAFLRLAASGGDVAVPWAALGQRKPTAPGDKDAFAVAMTKARLETAPRLGKDDQATLESRAFRDKLYEFFGVVTPTFEEPLGTARN